MRRDDAIKPEPVNSEDTDHILKRRRELQARSLGRWRKLLLAGVATGAAFGTLTCRAQVCLSQAIGLVCSDDAPSYPLQNFVGVFATWVEPSPGIFHISVTALIDTTWIGVGNDPLIFSGSPQPVDATVLQESVLDHDLSLVCEPAPAVTAVEIVLPLDCNGYAEAVHVVLDLTGDPADGLDVPVTWLD